MIEGKKTGPVPYAAAAILAALTVLTYPRQALFAAQQYSGWWLPSNIATEYGQRQDFLFFIILGITAVLAVIVYALMLYAFLFHRHRDGRKAVYTQGSRRFHIAVILFFTLFVVGGEIFVLGRVTGDMWDRVKAGIPADALPVEILAEQFAWNVRYPGVDGEFGETALELVDEENPFGLAEDDSAGADDIVAIGQLHIPVDTPVHVRLRAKDVLHSFYIPVLRVKQDALPGETIDVWIEANQTGTFQLACAELCGLGHTNMRASVIVESRAEYEQWLSEQAEER